MKQTYGIAMMCGVMAMSLTVVLAQEFGPDPFEISIHTIDGGGGSSAGGGFEVTGTIGQPDASTVALTGGNFEVRGGFWFGGTPRPNTCVADIAPPGGDGAVGVPDLLMVINQWSSSCGGCTADIAPPGGDGAVGVPDLLAIINFWGECAD